MGDKKRGVLNTTITQSVLDDFRLYCKKINCPMNTVLETFMTQFANGEFSIRIGKNMRVDFED